MQSSSALLERDRSVHRGRVAAFDHDPFCVRLETGLLEQNLQGHAGILHAMHHAVGVLTAVELGAAPFHAGIGGAFEKIDPVDARQTLELIERKNQRLFDQAMQHQPIVGWIDLGNAAMMAFEAQSIRRNDAVELMQRREADRGFGRRCQPGHGAADDVLFVFGWIAVGAHANALAELARPIGDIRRQVLGIVGARSSRARSCKPGSAQQESDGALCASYRSAVVIGTSRRMALRVASYHILFYECNSKLPLNPGNFHAGIGCHPHGFFRGDIALDQIPDRRTFGAFIHARPAGDHVFFLGFNGLAGSSSASLPRCADRSAWRCRLRSRARRSGPCRRPADSRDPD